MNTELEEERRWEFWVDPAEGRPERMMPLPGARPSEQAAGSERPSSQLWRAGALRAPVEEAEVAQYSLRPSPPGFPTAPGSLRRARGASGTGSGPSSTTVWLLTSPPSYTFLGQQPPTGHQMEIRVTPAQYFASFLALQTLCLAWKNAF